MEESGVVNFNEHLDPIHLLEESSIQFVDKLRDRFEVLSEKFNRYRGNSDSGSAIKIFKISNTVNDFMLFRNSLKLIIARRASDAISIGFLSSSGGLFSARLRDQESMPQAHEIRAHIGPFNEISWRFQNEIVDTEAVVRHYLTEFVKTSAR
jgi:hypothetical protein